MGTSPSGSLSVPTQVGHDVSRAGQLLAISSCLYTSRMSAGVVQLSIAKSVKSQETDGKPPTTQEANGSPQQHHRPGGVDV